jgi:DNA replication protein DnaC
MENQANTPGSEKCSNTRYDPEKERGPRKTENFKDIFAASGEKKPSHCGVCGSEVEVVSSPITSKTITYCPSCSEKEEQERKSHQREALKKQLTERMEIYLRKRGVPRRYLNARITDFPAHWQKLKESTTGLFLTGSRGLGKTHLAVALMREMIFTTQPVYRGGDYKIDFQRMPLFVSVPELLLEIRDTFNGSGASEKAVIDKYSWVDVLVLDDLGAEKTSDWVLQTLYTTMDRRYREELRTIITSNLSIEEIEEKFDDRVASRVAGMCRVCTIKGRDRRIS